MDRKEVVFQTKWFSVEEESFNHIESLQGEPYYRINLQNGVMVLALTEKREIVLVKQFRPAIREYTLELPSGVMDSSELPEETAKRELYEETGYRCKTLRPIGANKLILMGNRCNAEFYSFFGEGATKDDNFLCKEDIQVVLCKPRELKAQAVSGKFQQIAALGVIALAEWQMGGTI